MSHVGNAIRLFDLIKQAWADSTVELSFPNSGYNPVEGKRYVDFSTDNCTSELISTGPPQQRVIRGPLEATIAVLPGEGFAEANRIADLLDAIYFAGDRSNLTFYRQEIPRETGGNDTHTAYLYAVGIALYYYT